MSKIDYTKCDVCDKRIQRTFVTRYGKTEARGGKNSAKVGASMLRRFWWKITGIPFMYRQWYGKKPNSFMPWQSKDLCSNCRKSVEQEVKKQIEEVSE